jgi:hypothetical protein
VDRVAHGEGGNVDADDFRQILGQTLDFDGVHVDFQKAAEVPDAGCFTERFDRDLGMELLVGTHGMEIDVEHIAPNGVVLDFLDQREAVGRGAAVLDLEVHQDVLAGRMREQRGDLPRIERQADRLVVTAIDDGGDESLLLDFLYRSAACGKAWLRGYFQLFGQR